MKIIDRINNTRYLNKTDRIMYFERVFKLQEECSKFDMFQPLGRESEEFNDNELHCYYGEGETVGSIRFKRTFYFFHGNTCIIYYKSRHNRIVKVLVKSPEDEWRVNGYVENETNYNQGSSGLIINTTNVEVYYWWDVDWMNCGDCDSGTHAKPGSWWKTVYNDISGIYETVAKKSMDYVFDNIYSTYGKNQKI